LIAGVLAVGSLDLVCVEVCCVLFAFVTKLLDKLSGGLAAAYVLTVAVL
jgi:hypothetical protein